MYPTSTATAARLGRPVRGGSALGAACTVHFRFSLSEKRLKVFFNVAFESRRERETVRAFVEDKKKKKEKKKRGRKKRGVGWMEIRDHIYIHLCFSFPHFLHLLSRDQKREIRWGSWLLLLPACLYAAVVNLPCIPSYPPHAAFPCPCCLTLPTYNSLRGETHTHSCKSTPRHPHHQESPDPRNGRLSKSACICMSKTPPPPTSDVGKEDNSITLWTSADTQRGHESGHAKYKSVSSQLSADRWAEVIGSADLKR
ncbi:hypothetical protein B0H63DRAFT_162631 [Podospora didyma]|uniref:Uncharacterized protein n=1 Tax=Podospora didyma TaxID=330526 RepID=A0AAE0U1K8_9PEZI|nr:hypothetical protein B0H63DRAFT_162631 [Podospora didyma]